MFPPFPSPFFFFRQSKMVDYAKFDKIIDSDDEEEENIMKIASKAAEEEGEEKEKPALKPTIFSDQPPVKMTAKGTEKGRFKFEHEGRTIYEWDQNLEEVNLYLLSPPGVPRQVIDIVIGHKNLRIGIKGNPPFIDEATGGPVKPNESTWTLVDGEITINLQKMNKAEQWDCALIGKAGEKVDAFTQEEIKKKLLLERFQEEVI